MSFHDMGTRLVMVEFESPVDKVRVIRDGPWHFDKALLLIKDFVAEQKLRIFS